ncbi:ankyrin repeat and SOCS box protein 14-like [Lineus longissimus]|uniref:ankyrin repeat and SOCS box protein 14-like n=1 Tax=Lineus longissimus TaxID=88925 RepID=UPI002B4EA347
MADPSDQEEDVGEESSFKMSIEAGVEADIWVSEETARRNLLHKKLFYSMWTQEWEEFLSVLEKVPDLNHVLTLKCSQKCRRGKMFESFSCSMATWFGLAENQVCICLQEYPPDTPEGALEFAGVAPIHYAATLEDNRYLREIMARGGFVNARTLCQQLGPLNLAAHKSQMSTLRTLLSTCSSNACDSQELELRLQAATSENGPKCDAKICEYDSEIASRTLSDHSMAAKVCDVNITGKNGRTPFLTALMHDFREGAEELMKYGADVNKFDVYDTVPVIEATRRGYPLEFYEKMVEAGCQVDACPDGNYDVALHYAVYMEMVGLVELLLKSGSNPDKLGQSHTPLVIAAFVGRLGNVQMLVKYNANVNLAPTTADYTALHFAAWEGHLGICNELVNAGASPDARTRDKNTPLSLGAHGGHNKVVDFFLGLGTCDVNNQDKDKDTALHYSAYNGDVESTKALLRCGAAANSRNSVDATPLWNACYMSKLEIVKVLVKHNVIMELCSRGIDQHSQTDDVVLIYDSPKSPLYAAAERGAFGIIRYLVEEGYDINNEKWIHLSQLPSKVILDEEMRSWLDQEYHSPRSLIQLCRRAINRVIGDGIDKKSELLRIPNTLRDYLLHNY